MTDSRARAKLARRERAHQQRLAEAYRQILEELTRNLDGVGDLIAERTATGEAATPGWLYRQRRYRELLIQAETRFADLAAKTGVAVTDSQRAAIAQARFDADRAITDALEPRPPGAFVQTATLPADALDHLVANLAPRQPLSVVINDLPIKASQALRQELVVGTALGRNPTDIVARIKTALGASLARAMVIVRTETMRAYRQATLDVFRANDHLLDGWVWKAALSPRTCAACWAMHNTVHPLDEPFSGHPQCRCVASPRSKSWAELGYAGSADTRPALTSSEALFARLKPEDQLAILGSKAHAAYAAGEVGLTDFVKVTRSKRWGDMRSVASLEDALVTAELREPPVSMRGWRRRRLRPFRPNDWPPPGRYDPDGLDLARAAEAIRSLPYESGYGFDARGDLVFRQVGNESSSGGMADADVARLRDGVFLHNHPSYGPGWAQRAGSFSDTDLVFMTEFDMAEMRVVTAERTYIIRRRPEGFYLDPGEVREEYRRLARIVRRELDELAADGLLPPEDAANGGRLADEVVRRLSEPGYFDYVVEEVE